MIPDAQQQLKEDWLCNFCLFQAQGLVPFMWGRDVSVFLGMLCCSCLTLLYLQYMTLWSYILVGSSAFAF